VIPAGRKPWLPPGFSFLSGLPEPARQRRILMTIQAFVDESGGKGQPGRHFVLAGLVSGAERWAEFSNEWRDALAQRPAIKYFKMKEAAGFSGQFWRWEKEPRDAKLRLLAAIINRYSRISTHSVIDLEAHAKTWAKMPRPHKEPYFWPYQNTIMAVCFTLWELGWRDRFEIIYDHEVIFGPRARLWYPFIKRMMEIQYPEEATILPIDPMFQSDADFLPLQASDLFAWCTRDATNDAEKHEFNWLFEAMPNVKGTVYSQYYDFDRMKAVSDEAHRLAKEGEAPPELADLYAETRALMKHR
jgi:hypothetical protein